MKRTTSVHGRRHRSSTATATAINTSGRTRSAAAFRLGSQSQVRVITSGADFAPLDSFLDLAVRLVKVGAVVEAAPFRRLLEFGKGLAQRLGRDVPQAELANAGRIDHIRLAAEIEQSGSAGGVAAGAPLLVHIGGGELQASIERIENRRLADAAVADERARFALDQRSQCVDALCRARRTDYDRNSQLFIRLQLWKFAVLSEIDLVDADRRLRAATLRGDQESIDQPRTQRRRLDRHHIDDQIDDHGDSAP